MSQATALATTSAKVCVKFSCRFVLHSLCRILREVDGVAGRRVTALKSLRGLEIFRGFSEVLNEFLVQNGQDSAKECQKGGSIEPL